MDRATSLTGSVSHLASIASEEDFNGLGSRYFLFERATEPVATANHVGGQRNHRCPDTVTEGDFGFGQFETLVNFDGASLATWTLCAGAASIAEGSQGLECRFPTGTHRERPVLRPFRTPGIAIPGVLFVLVV